MRHAGRHGARPGAASRSRATRPSSSPRTSSPTGSAARSPSASGLAAAGLERARAFTWRRDGRAHGRRLPRGARPMSVSAVVVSHGHARELATLASGARAAGRRARRGREPAGLDAVGPSREGPGARERRARSGSRRTSTSASRRRPASGSLYSNPDVDRRAGRGRRAARLRLDAHPRCGIAGPRTRLARRPLAAVPATLPDRERHARPPDAAPAPLPTARAPDARTTTSTRTSTEPVEADWMLGAFLLLRRDDAGRDRWVRRGLPPLRRGHRPLLPRDASGLGALVRPRRRASRTTGRR